MLERGRYGVEWTKRPEDRDLSIFWPIVFVVLVLALVSFAVTLFRRMREDARGEGAPTEVVAVQPVSRPADATPARAADSTFTPPPNAAYARRPQKVRNLLMRLEVAESKRDVEMAVTTIEQLRALPGEPAADLDDALARRLGTLNWRRLFTLKNAQWVKTVTVKSGQSASRIAAESGSTFASLAKLNGGVEAVETIRPGQSLFVMDHPRFALVVRRRTRTADLQLNGKFFKRYDLATEAGRDGAYEATLPIRDFWDEIDVSFRPADRAELELLLPQGASVLVSEI